MKSDGKKIRSRPIKLIKSISMCIFCKIIAGEIPCYKVYEDEKVLAFLEIKPVNPGHVLVIPKNHYSAVGETPDEELAAVAIAGKKIGNLLKQRLGVKGYSLITFGKDIQHFHLHVVPWEGRIDLDFWPQSEYEEGEAEKIVDKLRS